MFANQHETDPARLQVLGPEEPWDTVSRSWADSPRVEPGDEGASRGEFNCLSSLAWDQHCLDCIASSTHALAVAP